MCEGPLKKYTTFVLAYSVTELIWSAKSYGWLTETELKIGVMGGAVESNLIASHE